MRAAPTSAVLTVAELTVRYGATTALDAVDLQIGAGEVHAVVGENGAGKSTLLRAIAGMLRPSEGRIQVVPGTRIAWVPQEVALPLDLSARDWIFLGNELRGPAGRGPFGRGPFGRGPFGWLRQRAMDDLAAAALTTVGCDVPPETRLGTLAVPQRKQVQLARALRVVPEESPPLLLLDEPTAVLGESDTQQLFAAIRARRDSGTAVLYVSHRLDEVLALADRVTVLRDGRRVSTDPVGAVDTATLVHRMVGRDVPPRRRRERGLGMPVLQVSDLSAAHVGGVALTVHHGEIVGLAGLVGAGRSEVLEAIAGVRRVRAGHIAATARPAFVPEDRGSKGLIATLTVHENLLLPAQGCWLRRRHERDQVAEWIRQLAIRTPGPAASITALSGGNQQKLLLARALRHQPQLLLLDEPTAGVDVGAKAEIHELICRLAEGGAAILLASSDLPELLTLCDRIVALQGGAVVGAVAGADADEPHLAALITGAGSAVTGAGSNG